MKLTPRPTFKVTFTQSADGLHIEGTARIPLPFDEAEIMKVATPEQAIAYQKARTAAAKASRPMAETLAQIIPPLAMHIMAAARDSNPGPTLGQEELTNPPPTESANQPPTTEPAARKAPRRSRKK